jgi:hypothetical protein
MIYIVLVFTFIGSAVAYANFGPLAGIVCFIIGCAILRQFPATGGRR